MKDQKELIIKGRRTLEMLAKEHSICKSQDDLNLINYHAVRWAYCFSENEEEANRLIGHYKYMREEYAKHDYTKKIN